MSGPLPPIGFWSYTSSDDSASHGHLSQLRRLLADDLQRLIGREPKVHIFQDVAAIQKGADWEEKIDQALGAASFMIAILTPAFLQSEWCCKEVLHFRAREQAMGRSGLIFPFHYTDTSHVDPDNKREVFDKRVHTLLLSRQHLDFRDLELEDPTHRDVRFRLRLLSTSVRDALRGAGQAASSLPRAETPPPGAQVADVEAAVVAQAAPAENPPPPPPVAAQPAKPQPPPWAIAAGTDNFGPWADIAVPDAPSVTQRMRLIKAGTFWMGSPDTEPGRFDAEGPAHRVAIAQDFWLFDTPVTQALWEAVMGDNPSYFQSPTRPVENVSFIEAQRFLTQINDLIPGLDLILPSEAQWEYACRAGTRTATYAGPMTILGDHNAPVLDKIAWYGGNSGVDFDLPNGINSKGWAGKQYNHTMAGTRAVKLKEPNAFGLYDMLGNVVEWCADAWQANYEDAPDDGSAHPAGSAAFRVIRGGAWNYDARHVRAAFRGGSRPSGRNGDLGFRCSRGHEQS